MFFLLGGGEGGVGGTRRGGGVRFSIENHRRGVFQERGGGLRGWEVVCGEFGGGGLNFFFSGPKCPPSYLRHTNDTMEMNGESTASYLSRSPRIPVLIYAFFIGLEAKGRLDFQGQRGIKSVVQWNLRPVILGAD